MHQTVGYGKEKKETKKIKVRPFVVEPAYVGWEKGLSEEIGGRWIKMRVSIFMPCYPDASSEMLQELDEWSDDILEEKLHKIKHPEEDSLEDGEYEDGDEDEF